MSPTADARTGRKAYADCRRDCRNTGINIQTGLREVNTRALLPAFLCSVPRLARSTVKTEPRKRVSAPRGHYP
jgi:hypothetical protein